MKALASPQHQSYHWDFDPPVPNRLTLTLDGVELASIDKVNIEREHAQMNEEATLGKRNRRGEESDGVKYLRSGGRYARKVRIKSTEPKHPNNERQEKEKCTTRAYWGPGENMAPS